LFPRRTIHLPGAMPRSEQMSTRTAPTGRRRSLAMISSGDSSSAGPLGGVAGLERRSLGTEGRRIGEGFRSWPRAARRRSLASSAAARSRPRAIRASIGARSVVPKILATKAK
jgi:hypothetical protein